MIHLEQFRAVELKVAKIIEARLHPHADRLLVLTVDIGGITKEIVAGIALHYRPSDLAGTLIVVVDNLEPAVIRGVSSNGMLLAARDGEGLSLIVPDKSVAPGSAVG